MMRMRKCLMAVRESNAPSSEGTELNSVGMETKGLAVTLFWNRHGGHYLSF
jgi:hypothetical protein